MTISLDTLQAAITAARNTAATLENIEFRAGMMSACEIIEANAIAAQPCELLAVGTLAWALITPTGNMRYWSRSRQAVETHHKQCPNESLVPIIGAAVPPRPEAQPTTNPAEQSDELARVRDLAIELADALELTSDALRQALTGGQVRTHDAAKALLATAIVQAKIGAE